MHRCYEKFPNVFPLPVKEQNCRFELKKICEFGMKTCNKKTKKCIPSRVDKSCYNTYRKTQVKVNKTVTQRNCEKSYSVFPFPIKKQNCHLEPKKVHKLEMKTRTKKDKKSCHFEPKKICEFEMKTRPKKAKKYNYTYEPMDSLTKQGACRDKMKQAHVSRHADPESQRSEGNEPANDLVETIYYEILEKEYQVQRCITGKDQDRGQDFKNEVVETNWNKNRLREYNWGLLAARSIWLFGHNLTGPNTLMNGFLLSEVDKRCYNTHRKTQVEACKTDVQRIWETFSNIFIFPAKGQNYHFEPKKIHELEIKTKKYSYTKDCKEQPREISDQCEKKSLQPLCNTQERLISTYEPKRIYELQMENHPKKIKEYNCFRNRKAQPREIRDQDDIQPLCNTQERIVRIYETNSFTLPAKDTGSWNQCWTVRPKECKCEKFFNSFTLPAKEQIYRFEPKKIYELEMKTHPQKTKKDGYIKDCKEQPREIRDQCDIQALYNTQERMVRIDETNRSILPAKEQIYRFEPKTIHELEMKTRPKKIKKDGYIKDCKEQPREVCDQCEKKNTQPLRDTQERMVRTYEPTENEGTTDRGQDSGSWNQCWTLGPNERRSVVLFIL